MVALLRMPISIKRFVQLPEKEGVTRFISLENVLGIYTGLLFPGYTIEASGAFRIIRDSDIEVEEEAEDLVRLFETALKRRRRGSVVRIEFESNMPENLRQFVSEELKLSLKPILAFLHAPLALSALSELAKSAAARFAL